MDKGVAFRRNQLLDGVDRWMLGRMHHPVRGLLHGSAAIASLAGTVLLVLQAPTNLARAAAAVFGLGLVALYTTSSLYHSVPWQLRWKKRMQRLDHSMIFVLIAASYTPVTLIVLEGSWRWVAMTVVWGLAAIGVVHRLMGTMESHIFSFCLMAVMGWLALPFMTSLARAAGSQAVILLVLGGISYTVGLVLFVTRWPTLWPRVFSTHELFHVLVVTASVLHWMANYHFVLPAAAL